MATLKAFLLEKRLPVNPRLVMACARHLGRNTGIQDVVKLGGDLLPQIVSWCIKGVLFSELGVKHTDL